MNYRVLLLEESTQTIVNCVGLFLSFYSFFFTTRINGEFSIALCNVNVALVDLIVLIFIVSDLE